MTEEEQTEIGFLPWYAPVLAQIWNLKEQNRLPHALIIQSSFSNGGSSFLKQLVMLLLCSSVKQTQACGVCKSCRQIMSDCYADAVTVTVEHNEKTKKLNRDIKIDQVRKLIYFLGLSSQHQNLKIATIYPAEKMNQSAANSLLKTLEEPADGSLILLMTHNAGRLPITIRSRCQQLQMNLPETKLSTDWLEAKGLAPDHAKVYLDYAAKDPALALELHALDFSQIMAQFRQQLRSYLKQQDDVTSLVTLLQNLQPVVLRLILQKVFAAYIHQFIAVNQVDKSSLNESPDPANKATAVALMDLQQRSVQQLQVENNNLNLQLQLADVLISLKQILSESRN